MTRAQIEIAIQKWADARDRLIARLQARLDEPSASIAISQVREAVDDNLRTMRRIAERCE